MTLVEQEYARLIQRWDAHQKDPSWSVQNLQILEAAINELAGLVLMSETEGS
jgi:hypothetical protein